MSSGNLLATGVATAGGREATQSRASESPWEGEGRTPEQPDPTKNTYCPVLNFCQIRVMARDCSGRSSVCTKSLCRSSGVG